MRGSRSLLASVLALSTLASGCGSNEPTRAVTRELEQLRSANQRWASAGQAWRRENDRLKLEAQQLQKAVASSFAALQIANENTDFWQRLASAPAPAPPTYTAVRAGTPAPLPAQFITPGYPRVVDAWDSMTRRRGPGTEGLSNVTEIRVTANTGQAPANSLAWVGCDAPTRINIEQGYARTASAWDMELTLVHELRHTVQCFDGGQVSIAVWQREAELAAAAYRWHRYTQELSDDLTKTGEQLRELLCAAARRQVLTDVGEVLAVTTTEGQHVDCDAATEARP